MKSNRAAVTGGAGFIGSHLAEELVKRDYQVTILDNLFSGRMENLAGLIRKDNVQFIEGSITNLSLLKEIFQNIDFVFHQAAISSVPGSIEDPSATSEVNITGTLNVLLAARDNQVKKVIYASSSAVYGDTPALPKREDLLPSPQSPYAVSKLAAEHYCQVFQEVYGVTTVCLRYFNVYGPRQNPDSQYAAVIPIFIKRAAEGSPLTIFGDGKQTRDLVYISDVVEANILAAESNASGVYNIGQGKSITINELAKLIIKLVGTDVKPVYQQPRDGDVRHSLADISKAKTFGYEPEYGLEEGLKETIGSYRE